MVYDGFDRLITCARRRPAGTSAPVSGMHAHFTIRDFDQSPWEESS